MRTVILRLSGAAIDGGLHGVLEVVGTDGSTAFSGDEALLALLHASLTDGIAADPSLAPHRPEPHLNEATDASSSGGSSG